MTREENRVLTALAATASTVSAAPRAARPAPAVPAARPDFRLPFACGQTWQLQTYRGHAPDDKKLDMYRVGGNTLGSTVAAPAAGTATEFFEPGGLEINHGNGWFTVYLHMHRIDVRLGQQVASGTTLGRLGLTGTTSAHLYYEQLYDTNGDNDGENDEMVHPVIQGTEYRLSPDGLFPQVTSTNACDGGGDPTRYWVGTFADATSYAAVDCVGDIRPQCAPQGKLQPTPFASERAGSRRCGRRVRRVSGPGSRRPARARRGYGVVQSQRRTPLGVLLYRCPARHRCGPGER